MRFRLAEKSLAPSAITTPKSELIFAVSPFNESNRPLKSTHELDVYYQYDVSLVGSSRDTVPTTESRDRTVSGITDPFDQNSSSGASSTLGSGVNRNHSLLKSDYLEDGPAAARRRRRRRISFKPTARAIRQSAARSIGMCRSSRSKSRSLRRNEKLVSTPPGALANHAKESTTSSTYDQTEDVPITVFVSDIIESVSEDVTLETKQTSHEGRPSTPRPKFRATDLLVDKDLNDMFETSIKLRQICNGSSLMDMGDEDEDRPNENFFDESAMYHDNFHQISSDYDGDSDSYYSSDDDESMDHSNSIYGGDWPSDEDIGTFDEYDDDSDDSTSTSAIGGMLSACQGIPFWSHQPSSPVEKTKTLKWKGRLPACNNGRALEVYIDGSENGSGEDGYDQSEDNDSDAAQSDAEESSRMQMNVLARFSNKHKYNFRPL